MFTDRLQTVYKQDKSLNASDLNVYTHLNFAASARQRIGLQYPTYILSRSFHPQIPPPSLTVRALLWEILRSLSLSHRFARLFASARGRFPMNVTRCSDK